MFSIIASLAAQAALAGTAPAPAPTQTEPVIAATFGGASKLDPTDLNGATAREDVAQFARADQVARVANNRINGPSTTGSVTISDNAFQNLSGLAIINANSGNNVAINSALNVNVNITRPQ